MVAIAAIGQADNVAAKTTEITSPDRNDGPATLYEPMRAYFVPIGRWGKTESVLSSNKQNVANEIHRFARPVEVFTKVWRQF